MHARRVLQKLLQSALVRLDARNARTLLNAVEALLAGRRLTLMELARHWPGALKFRAPLKCLDRWLGNAAVQAQRRHVYQLALAFLLRSATPVLVVDWSELKRDGRWHLLRAGVVCRGRTLTVYEEVHPQKHLGSRKVQAAFLRSLHELLPAQCVPILLTDAGFGVTWFKAVEEHGWHWLGRLRGRRMVCSVQTAGAWIPIKRLYAQAGTRAIALGDFHLRRRQPLCCRLVLVKRRLSGRVEFNRYGAKRRSGHSRKMARSQREAWLIGASLSLANYTPAQLARLYAKRMQIEQSFRDLKSHRYGCAFEDTLTRCGRRLEMLLLIQMLATLVAWLAALAQPLPEGKTPRHSVLWQGWELLRQAARLRSDPKFDSSALQSLLNEPLDAL